MKDKIIEILRERIRFCYRDLIFMKNKVSHRKDWIEGYRCRVDELLLLWHEIHDISLIDACIEFGIDYKLINVEKEKTNETRKTN